MKVGHHPPTPWVYRVVLLFSHALLLLGSLLLCLLTTLADPREDVLSVLVELEFCNHYFAWVDTDRD